MEGKKKMKECFLIGLAIAVTNQTTKQTFWLMLKQHSYSVHVFTRMVQWIQMPFKTGSTQMSINRRM
jgi:hypothetical protein